MHYYKFDVSAWCLHTAHLTLEEEGVYLRLVNMYYDTEQPIPNETQTVCRRLRLGNQEIVLAILAEFFTPSEDGWRNKRCDAELAAYHAKSERNRAVGRLGGRPKKETQMVSKQNPNETQTINYKLETKNKEKPTKVGIPDGVSDDLWADWLALRKQKKLPVTATALKGLQREADKAKLPIADVLRICCERGWGGFKTEWVADDLKARQSAHPKRWWDSVEATKEKAKELKLDWRAGETFGQLVERLRAATGE